jgi:hypothetical protein
MSRSGTSEAHQQRAGGTSKQPSISNGRQADVFAKGDKVAASAAQASVGAAVGACKCASSTAGKLAGTMCERDKAADAVVLPLRRACTHPHRICCGKRGTLVQPNFAQAKLQHLARVDQQCVSREL